MRYRIAAIAASAALVGSLAPAAAQQRQTLQDFSYSAGVKNGDCKLAMRARDGVTMVDFGLGFNDSVFSVEAVRPRWEIIDNQDRDETKLPVKLIYDTGVESTSEFGGFRDGMHEGVWGLWHGSNSDPVQSQRGLEALMNATSATVEFDGKVLAEVNLGPKGFAANNLLDCAIADREKPNQ